MILVPYRFIIIIICTLGGATWSSTDVNGGDIAYSSNGGQRIAYSSNGGKLIAVKTYSMYISTSG